MFNSIVFGDREMNGSHQCYVVGQMGCKSIEEVNHGNKNGLDICSYEINFEDGSQKEVRDTIYVSD